MQELKISKDVPGKADQKTRVNEDQVNQINLLQKTIGNQKVQELIKLGALPSDQYSEEPEYNKAEKKREAIEEAQIAKDKEALTIEIEKMLKNKNRKLEKLKSSRPGSPIYANVTIDLVYANIPGEAPLRLYHYTNLKDVDISYSNLDERLSSISDKRTETIGTVYSFLYDLNQETQHVDNEAGKERDESGEMKEPEAKEKKVIEEDGASGESQNRQG